MVQVHGDTRNRLITPDLIANESLFRLFDSLLLPRMSNRTYQKYFAQKIGDHITVKRPYRARATAGQQITSSQISSLIDETVQIAINKQFFFALETDDLDMTLSIREFGERYLNAGCEELAYRYDEVGFDELADGFFHMSGTAGTAISTGAFLNATADAMKVAIPSTSTRYAIIDPLDMATISNDVKLVNVPNMVEKAIREHYMGNVGGWRLYQSVHVPPLVVPSQAGNTPVLHSSSEVRGSTIVVSGLAASQLFMKKGNMFSLAGVGEIQPRGSRQKTYRSATFTVTEDVSSNASGQATVNFYPYINDGDLTIEAGSGVSGETIKLTGFETVDAVPAASAAVTVVGGDTSGEKAYRQCLLYDKRALEYLMLPLHNPMSGPYTARKTHDETGLSIAVLGDINWNNRTEMIRIDTLFGVKNIYPELGLRLLSSELT